MEERLDRWGRPIRGLTAGYYSDGAPRGHPSAHEEALPSFDDVDSGGSTVDPYDPMAPQKLKVAQVRGAPAAAPRPAQSQTTTPTQEVEADASVYRPAGATSYETPPEEVWGGAGASPTAAPAGAPAGPAAPGAAKPALPMSMEQLMQKASERAAQRPDASEWIEQARQREQGSRDDMLAGMIMSSMGGESFSGIGGHVLQQAMKNRGPMEIPGGWGTVTGDKVSWNPAKQQEADLKHLEFLIGQQRQVETAKEATIQRAEQARLERARRREHDAEMLEFRKGVLAAKGSGDGSGGKVEPAGATSDGRRLIRDKHGNQYAIDPVTGARTPYHQAGMSQSALDKQVEFTQQAQASAARYTDVEKMVAANPKAFSGANPMLSLAPDIVASRIRDGKFTGEEAQAYMLVQQQSSMLLNEIFGAAQSAGEMHRAAPWMPKADDSLKTTLNKLKAARQWQEMKARTYGSGIQSVAEQRSNPGGTPAAPGRGAPPPGAVVRE